MLKPVENPFTGFIVFVFLLKKMTISNNQTGSSIPTLEPNFCKQVQAWMLTPV
jgi:hypothetical protein